MDYVTIYTDGACSGNPGPGGWAAILRINQKKKEISGGETVTTNNRMELMAVISALEMLKRRCNVAVFTDSQYIERAVNAGWLADWKARGWRRKEGELKNVELWKRLDELITTQDVTFHWVKSHADNPYNNRCDALAVEQRNHYKKNWR